MSLSDHISQLKEQYPNAKVQTRRDRDGFAIVKVSFKPEFKYDLDAIMAHDPAFMKEHQAETLETILRTCAGGADNIEQLKSMT